MKAIVTIFLTAALGAQPMASAPGIQIVPGSRIDGVLPAMSDWGDTVIDTRELKADLLLPSGKPGKGAAFFLFDRTTGYYLCLDRWETNDYPKDLTAKVVSFDRRIGVTREGLFLFALGNPTIYVFHSSEKAGTMDEAESKYVQWAAGHIADIEAHKTYAKAWGELHLFVLGGIPGFIPEGLREQSGVPVELLAITRNDGYWQLTLKGNYKVRVKLTNSPGNAAGRPVLGLILGPDAVVCLGDRNQEIDCPKLTQP